jgi:hypothetical protein
VKRLLSGIWAFLSWRLTPPLVMSLFLLLYIGIAFFTDETLVALIALTGKNPFLIALFALLPLSSAARIMVEARTFLGRRRSLASAQAAAPGLFDETVTLDSGADPAALDARLRQEGYRTRSAAGSLSAWRGFSRFPARMLYLAGTFCLFAGILISLSTRTSLRSTVIEGDTLLDSPDARVERIALEESTGAILAKRLEIVVSRPGSTKVFGLYPPSRFEGAFVYPRYLGLGLLVRFSAPDLPSAFEQFCPLNLSRTGKEANQPIPGSPYRIVFSLADPGDGTDPYLTGKMQFLFKLLKEKEVVASGSVPPGGEFAKDGYLLQVPDARRVVITDFIRDYGVTLIWIAFLLIGAAACLWLPVQLFLPRRELFFQRCDGRVVGCSRAEGQARRHAGVFQEALDLLESGQRPLPDPPPKES